MLVSQEESARDEGQEAHRLLRSKLSGKNMNGGHALGRSHGIRIAVPNYALRRGAIFRQQGGTLQTGSPPTLRLASFLVISAHSIGLSGKWHPATYPETRGRRDDRRVVLETPQTDILKMH